MADPDNENRPLILLTGGTGYVGGRLIPLLEKQRVRLRCLARSPEKMRPRVQPGTDIRSEEHTSELQSRRELVCRLLLEKKKKRTDQIQNQKKKRTKKSRIILNERR